MHPIAGLRPGDTPAGLNASGQVLVYTDPYPDTLGSYVILTNGARVAAVTDPAARNTNFRLTGFGPQGQIAGVSQHGDPSRGYYHGSIVVANGAIVHDELDGGNTARVAFNRGGQSVSSPSGDGWLSGLFTNGGVHSSRTLPGQANALNDIGEVVGHSKPFPPVPGQAQYATLLTATTAQDLNALLPPSFTGHLDDALKINNLGQILATGTIGGERHSFLLTPRAVPEPASWLVACAAIVAWLARRSGARG